MAFAPIGERHAIAEVVFALQISPAVTHDDRNNLKEAHERWKSFLPRMVERTMLAVAMSTPEEQPPPPPVAPLEFVRHESDGNLGWRLHIDDRNITVNCLTYTRWPHIWKQARALFAAVSEVLPETTLIESVYLQYVNVFTWDGTTEGYDSRALLDEQSACVPASVLDRGPHWHLHQGWFSPLPEPPGGRVLDRVHIDAIDDPAGRHVVKFENLHRFDFERNDGFPGLREALSPATTAIDPSFERLHDRAKRSLGDYLNGDIQRSINLHAS